jgi:hypothetical protein
MFTITINIDITIYNLQHTSSCIICISSSVVRHTQDHIKPTYIYSKISASRRRERHWTILGWLLPLSLDIFKALILIERCRHHHRLPPGLLIWLFLGIIFLPSIIDISKCCPFSSTEVLSRLKPICFLTFKSENKHIHLVIILNNWNLEAVHMRHFATVTPPFWDFVSHLLWCQSFFRFSWYATVSRWFSDFYISCYSDLVILWFIDHS